MTAALKDLRLPPLEGAKPKHAVIFLHGVGDRAAGGLLEIGRMWRPALPDTEFFCPDAPFPFEGAPAWENGGARQWFSLRDFTLPAMHEGAKLAAPYLNTYIDGILASRGLAPGKLALVGFSQGTIMALYVAPRRAQPLAGVAGYAGVLTGAEFLKEEKKSAPPVLLVHGTADEVVPFELMRESEAGLRAADIPVETLACPGLGHSIDQRGIAGGLSFLRRIFA